MLVKTPTAEEGEEQERYMQEILNDLNYYKGKAEALEKALEIVVKLLKDNK